MTNVWLNSTKVAPGAINGYSIQQHSIQNMYEKSTHS